VPSPVTGSGREVAGQASSIVGPTLSSKEESVSFAAQFGQFHPFNVGNMKNAKVVGPPRRYPPAFLFRQLRESPTFGKEHKLLCVDGLPCILSSIGTLIDIYCPLINTLPDLGGKSTLFFYVLSVADGADTCMSAERVGDWWALQVDHVHGIVGDPFEVILSHDEIHFDTHGTFIPKRMHRVSLRCVRVSAPAPYLVVQRQYS
jgi:hypothetical protein